jgi:hypothetical protein
MSLLFTSEMQRTESDDSQTNAVHSLCILRFITLSLVAATDLSNATNVDHEQSVLSIYEILQIYNKYLSRVERVYV